METRAVSVGPVIFQQHNGMRYFGFGMNDCGYTSICDYAPQFVGHEQHDAHELMMVLLDVLQEDLNKVQLKPYIELKDADGRIDEVSNSTFFNFPTCVIRLPIITRACIQRNGKFMCL
ncbi:unnamed protein product [Dibothriocephalus latus]|uniref:Peptidase C19 ubiquitin carboxyl-terminal hydrolase domain-containing protein n=1 Tax=Dibothriocephalus latus TaxID=60516 RepID=A0A3P6RFT5_DIBLA|nr:unnamed protein product [Dibothriocephalus latus]